MSSNIEIPFGSTAEIPVTLNDAAGVPITFTGSLYIMVKADLEDLDSAAIIDKEIEIVNTDGDPYHGILSLTVEDTSHPVNKYFFDLKTNNGTSWLSSDVNYFEITRVVRQGNPA